MSSRDKMLAVEENIGRVIVGKERVVRLVMTALLSGGHVLLEDVPGTGKTMLAKSLARSLAVNYRRIQFTPDLLPTDITGLSVWRAGSGEFEFMPGPVFTNILLADEINRATPRTQAGLLECMEERQVTSDGVTRPLAEPFFVIATQNPIETSGTFPLPEAQLDRFIMKLSMGFPDPTEELAILKRFRDGNALDTISPVAEEADLLTAREEAARVAISDDLMQYMTDLIVATRKRDDVSSGVSPRGSLALMRAARVFAFLEGRSFVVPEDIKAIAVSILAHRLILPRSYALSTRAEDIVEEILRTVPVPTEEIRA